MSGQLGLAQQLMTAVCGRRHSSSSAASIRPRTSIAIRIRRPSYQRYQAQEPTTVGTFFGLSEQTRAERLHPFGDLECARPNKARENERRQSSSSSSIDLPPTAQKRHSSRGGRGGGRGRTRIACQGGLDKLCQIPTRRIQPERKTFTEQVHIMDFA